MTDKTEPTKRRSKPERVAEAIQDLTMRDIDVLASELVKAEPRVASLLADSIQRVTAKPLDLDS